jgi:hypothetical protein
MFPREVLQTLVFGLAVLIVAFAVVMGGFALVQGTTAQAASQPGQSDPLASALYGVGIGLLVLLVIDAVLLLVALGINELGRRE